MDMVFYWTGAMVWGLLAGAMTLLTLLVTWRAVQATLDVAAQVIRCYRRGQPRSEYYAPVGQVWVQQFWSGTWSELKQNVRKACGPVTPWVKGENTRNTKQWIPGG